MSSAFGKAKFETPEMVCRTCGKTAKGPVQPHWLDMDIRNPETKALEECAAFCRTECMTTWLNKETKTMIDPTTRELEAVTLAGYAGGQFLESIRKTDLATLSGEEWTAFLLSVIGTYGEKIGGLMDSDVPF